MARAVEGLREYLAVCFYRFVSALGVCGGFA